MIGLPSAVVGKDDNCNYYEMRDSSKEQNPELQVKSCATCKHLRGGSGCELKGDSFIRQ